MSDWIEASLFAETGTHRTKASANLCKPIWIAGGWAVYEDEPEMLVGPKHPRSCTPHPQHVHIGPYGDLHKHLQQWLPQGGDAAYWKMEDNEVAREVQRWRTEHAKSLLQDFLKASSASKILSRYVEAANKEDDYENWDDSRHSPPKRDELYDGLDMFIKEAITAKKEASK